MASLDLGALPHLALIMARRLPAKDAIRLGGTCRALAGAQLLRTAWPHAARALALLAPTQAEAWARYLEGWASLSPASGTDSEDTNEDPMRKPVMDALAREMCEFCRATGMLSELRSFIPTVPQVNRSLASNHSLFH